MSVKRLPEVIALTLLIIFSFIRFPSTPWNRVMHSDGKGYYAHLPAIFIYQDLEYNFNDAMEDKYYPPNRHMAKNFRFKFRGETVNKTFSGITILWLPFFLLAHFLSYLLGFPTDGYSLLYQISIGLSAIFYFWIGSRLLLKLLKEFDVPERTAGFILIAFTFGTNLFYYLLMDPSLTHAYNFCIITCFLLYVKRFSDLRNTASLLMATASFALLICIRPQDGFIAFSLPFVLGSVEKTKQFFLDLFGNIKRLLLAVSAMAAFIAVPVTLWYLQTGYFLVYSYGEERFVWGNPQFLNVLFSYQKGLFVYTPVVFISMAGFIWLFVHNKFRFFSLAVFLIINTYIIASWEEWWYGCSYGHRVFIDFYSIAAILLGLTYLLLEGKKWLKWMLHALIVCLIVFNLIQAYQHYISVVPGCFNNKTLYWDNFLKLVPDARAPMSEPGLVPMDTISYDIENLLPEWRGWENSSSAEIALSGGLSSKLGPFSAFSVTHQMDLDSQVTAVKIRAMVYAKSSDAKPVLVVDLQDSTGTSVDYHNAFMEKFMRSKKWFLVEFSHTFPARTADKRQLVVYFWYPDATEEVYIDDIEIIPFRRESL